MKYIATPYSHMDPAVRERRYLLAIQAVLALHKVFPREMIYSPIVYWHPAALLHNLPTEHGYWEQINNTEIAHCDELLVIQLKGWEHSRGIAREILQAQIREVVTITYLSPSDLGIPEE
jgi:hypothetical protein